MTQDFKDNLLKYLTGKLPSNATGENYAKFLQPSIDTSDVFEQLATLNNYWIGGVLQSKNADNSNASYNLIYGNYSLPNDTTYRGFFLVTDSEGKSLQLITTLTNTQLIPKCYCLAVLEDGRFAGVFASSNTTNKFQFNILNNICLRLQTSDDFTAEFRSTVFIPTSTQLNNCEDIGAIYKNPVESKYLIAGRMNVYNGVEYVKVPVVTEFVYIVGQQQEWNDYSDSTPPSEMLLTDCTISSLYGLWTDKGLNIDLLAYYVLRPEYIAYCYKTDTNNTFNISAMKLGVAGKQVKNFKSLIIGTQNVYFGFNYSDSSGLSSVIYRVDPNEEALFAKQIFERKGSADSTLWDSMYFDIQEAGNEIITTYTYNTLVDSKPQIQFYVGIVENNDVSDKMIGTTSTNVSHEMFILNNQFNLYNSHLIIDDSMLTSKLVYNRNNYNGEPFENSTMLIPNSAVLYNNDVPIFARNLYNKTINQNVTTSTVEVPNQNLNDIDINGENLLGKTNLVLNQETKTINKNIYEVLHVNFINTINLEDRNDTGNIKLNPLNGQIGLNNVMSSDTSPYGTYQDITLTKNLIEYQDGTFETHDIGQEQITIANNIATYQIGVYLTKKAKNLYLVSQNTTAESGNHYIVIDISSLDVKKDYTIQQNVRVE